MRVGDSVDRPRQTNAATSIAWSLRPVPSPDLSTSPLIAASRPDHHLFATGVLYRGTSAFRGIEAPIAMPLASCKAWNDTISKIRLPRSRLRFPYGKKILSPAQSGTFIPSVRMLSKQSKARIPPLSLVRNWRNDDAMQLLPFRSTLGRTTRVARFKSSSRTTAMCLTNSYRLLAVSLDQANVIDPEASVYPRRSAQSGAHGIVESSPQFIERLNLQCYSRLLRRHVGTGDGCSTKHQCSLVVPLKVELNGASPRFLERPSPECFSGLLRRHGNSGDECSTLRRHKQARYQQEREIFAGGQSIVLISKCTAWHCQIIPPIFGATKP